MANSPAPSESRMWLSSLAFALVFPSLVTAVYFVLLAGPDQSPAVRQSAYGLGKTIQFLFPVFWIALVCRQPIRWGRPTRAGLAEGFAFGLSVSLAMVALYGWVLKPMGVFDGPQKIIEAKIRDLALDTLPRYVATGVFYSLCHSFLEEYYWRWFVFGQLRQRASLGVAVSISSVGFMAHHVILLGTYFGWMSPVTLLFSVAVAVGGAVWAWIYHRAGTLYGPWLSHCLVDAAIFLIGFDLAKEMFK